ncbi:MAG: alpha/beta hydrolase [Roseburia sp.]|nr:alpha/beta hydrolase [Roseburia sp.]
MIYKYPLENQKLDLSEYTAAHAGDKTVQYKTVDGMPICLSYYYPNDYNSSNKYPVFLFIHGGGWASHKIFDGEQGWQGDYLGYLARYYAKKGFVSVSIDYRLSSPDGQAEKYQIIDCYDDCADAVDYILDRASDCGIDTENVFVLGESAGGHLAGLVTTKYNRPGFQLKGSFLVNAITDLEGDIQWKERVPKKSAHSKLAKMPESEYAKYLSPLYNVSENTCPVVLIHGEQDSVVALAHSEGFYQRMEELKRECELHVIESTNHAFLLAEYTDNLAACKTGIRIIDQWLSEKGF